LFAKKLALAAVTAAIAAVGVTGVAHGATAGQTCQVNPNSSGWDIRYYWGATYYFYDYKVYYPDSVVIDGLGQESWGRGDYYYAHTVGNSTGLLLKTAVNESTCQ